MVGFVSCYRLEGASTEDEIEHTKHNTPIPHDESCKEYHDTDIGPDLPQHFGWVAERGNCDAQTAKQPVFGGSAESVKVEITQKTNHQARRRSREGHVYPRGNICMHRIS